MSWPALLKAKDNARNISIELNKMLKEAGALNKKDIVNYKGTILSEIDNSIGLISGEIEELERNLKLHRKYFEAKFVFPTASS